MPRCFLLGFAAVTATLLSGCGPSHEEVLRGRAQQFATGLVQENYEVCVQLTDPRFVQQKGLEGTKLRFQVLGFFVKLGKLTGEDVRIEEIRVADDALTAAVNLSIRIGGEWKRMDPQTWARVEGEWYITFDR